VLIFQIGTTQNRWLTRGLDPTLTSVRVANYVKTLRRDLLKVAEACGVEHPSLLDADTVEFLDAGSTGTTLRELYCYRPEWRHPSPHTREAIVAIMPEHGAARWKRPAIPHRHRMICPAVSRGCGHRESAVRCPAR
jgi:hypothetical protein